MFSQKKTAPVNGFRIELGFAASDTSLALDAATKYYGQKSLYHCISNIDRALANVLMVRSVKPDQHAALCTRILDLLAYRKSFQNTKVSQHHESALKPNAAYAEGMDWCPMMFLCAFYESLNTIGFSGSFIKLR